MLHLSISCVCTEWCRNGNNSNRLPLSQCCLYICAVWGWSNRHKSNFCFILKKSSSSTQNSRSQKGIVWEDGLFSSDEHSNRTSNHAEVHLLFTPHSKYKSNIMFSFALMLNEINVFLFEKTHTNTHSSRVALFCVCVFRKI